jgi:hypothetical protein
MRAVDTTDVRYLRSGGQGGARIRYRRMGVGRPAKVLGAEMSRKIAQVAYMICMRAPDEADSILELPSRRVGRMFKAALRRTQKTVFKRRCFMRRTTSCVLRA